MANGLSIGVGKRKDRFIYDILPPVHKFPNNPQIPSIWIIGLHALRDCHPWYAENGSSKPPTTS